MTFVNRIRLPFKLTRPQFPEERTVYRKADGTTKTLSAVIKKTYEGETDYWPEKWHERFAIALGHDNVNIEGDKYLGGVSRDGDYAINWQPFLDYPTAKAKFSVNVTPFDATNSNCMTCEEANQLNLADDIFPEPLNENTEYTIEAAANDEICCYPAVFSITTFNAAYLSSAAIDQTGQITLHTKTGLVTANGINLVTYRVTCPNGAFDEANVKADITGTVSGCLAPTDLIISNVTSGTAQADWVAPAIAPDHYHWQLYAASDPGTLLQSGDTATTEVDLSGLIAGTEYIFYVRSQCDATNDDATASNYVNADFTTSTASSTCGSYRFIYHDPTVDPGTIEIITYLDCNGIYQTLYVPNLQTRSACLLQTGPLDPAYMNIPDLINTEIEYEGNCP